MDKEHKRTLKPKKIVRLLIGLGLLIAITSQGRLDPTPFNLLTPNGGIQNWLGITGALIGGTLIECMGQMSVLFPFSLLFVDNSAEQHPLRLMIKNIITVFLLVSLAASTISPVNPILARLTGLWGIATNIALVDTLGHALAFGLILCILLIHNYRILSSYRFDFSLFILLSALLITVAAFLRQLLSLISSFGKIKHSTFGRAVQRYARQLHGNLKSSRDRLYQSIKTLLRQCLTGIKKRNNHQSKSG